VSEVSKKAKERQENLKDRRKNGGQRPTRKPRGPLFHSGDPTLAKRLEEEVYRSER
jgi:hypothetical protein